MSIVETNDALFEQHVVLAKKPVLLNIWVEWCGPCLALSPILEKLVLNYEQHLSVMKLNADLNPNTAQKLQVDSFPTLILFQGNKIIERLSGMQSEQKLKAFLDEKVGHLDAHVHQ